MMTLKDVSASSPSILFEYFYSDGIAWGVGTRDEAIEAAQWCGEPVDQLRYKAIG